MKTKFIVLMVLALACFALSPAALAADPAQGGSYPNQNTAEGDDLLFSFTTDADNTAMGFDALYSNPTGSDNALASWIWRITGNLNNKRGSHTATLLQNGMVLVAAGGEGATRLASAELYDPASRAWTVTGSLNNARDDHTATLLPNGKVLVAGGFNLTSGALASAELYDPASGTWAATGSLNPARNSHAATLLPNGVVLVAGGRGTGGHPILARAELGHRQP